MKHAVDNEVHGFWVVFGQSDLVAIKYLRTFLDLMGIVKYVESALMTSL